MITSMARARLGRAQRYTIRSAFGGLLAFGLGEGSCATAAELSIQSSVSQNIEANDNIDLDAVSAGVTLISRTSVATTFTAAMPTYVLGGDVDLRYVAYSGAGSGERENRLLPRFALRLQRESKTTDFCNATNTGRVAMAARKGTGLGTNLDSPR